MFKEEIKKKNISLHDMSANKFGTVESIPKGTIRSQLLRFGLMEGQPVECISKLPGGTIVLKFNRQEIAIGSTLAKKIIMKG